MKNPIWIYVAGPYSKGDTALHCVNACKVAEVVYEYGGFVPFVPHLTHLWHLTSPHDYAYWMELDAHHMARCDCLIRLPGESAGADEEIKAMIAAGKPVVLLDDISDESVERAAEELLRKLDPRPEVSDV